MGFYEILSVGYFRFQEKCEKRIEQMLNNNTTVVLLVSHQIEQIEKLCNKVLWLDRGHIKIIGETKEVCEMYKQQRDFIIKNI